jgi:hypothetical protein
LQTLALHPFLTKGENDMTQIKWQPIETAPINEKVILGRWENENIFNDDGIQWRTEIGNAWKIRFYFWKVKADYGGRATHWKPLPDAPLD